MPRKHGKRSKLRVRSLSPRLDIPKAIEFKQHLIAHGYKEPKLSLLLAQAANESAGFKSVLSKDEFNFGGVKYQKTFSKSATASKGHSAPAKENNGKRTSYDSYKSIDDFIVHWPVRAHLNEMKFKNKIGPPLDATDFKDYAHRLKLNHYYQETEEKYLAFLLSWDKTIRKELPRDNFSRPPLFEPNIPRTNFTDDLRIVVPIVDPKKSLYQKEKINSGGQSQSIQLYPLDWKFNTDQENDRLPNGSNQEIFDPFKANRFEPSSIMNVQKEMKSSFLEYPALMYNSPAQELRRPASDLYNISTLNATTESPAFSFRENTGGSGGSPVDRETGESDMAEQNNNDQGPDKRGNTAGQIVNINLNTPLIGSLTMSTTNTSNNLDELRYKVEEVLLEVLNSANAIS